MCVFCYMLISALGLTCPFIFFPFLLSNATGILPTHWEGALRFFSRHFSLFLYFFLSFQMELTTNPAPDGIYSFLSCQTTKEKFSSWWFIFWKKEERRYYTEDYKLIATREQVGVGVGEDKMTLYSPIAWFVTFLWRWYTRTRASPLLSFLKEFRKEVQTPLLTFSYHAVALCHL